MKNTLNEIFSLMERIDSSYRNYAMLNESQGSKSVSQAKKLYMERTGKSYEDAEKFIETVRHDISSLKGDGLKFILGVTRMALDSQIQDANTISKLNTTIDFITADKRYYDKFDKNLNNVSAKELIGQFEQAIDDEADNDRQRDANTKYTENTEYQIVPINSFEEAQRYDGYNDWCITSMEDMFDSYTCNGINQIYFCLRNGFENEPEVTGENCPLDSYGLSMISVIVNEKGHLAYSTIRWNHKNGGNDKILKAKQISELIGRSFYDTFKPNNKWASMVEDAMQRLANGEDPKDVFDEVYRFKNGFTAVELKGKWNYINAEGQLVSPNQWFDGTSGSHEGFATVKIDGKGWNFINPEGEYLNPNQWYGYVEGFREGFALVALDDKGFNFINTEGQLVSPNRWFDWVDSFREGFAKVQLDGKGYNILKTNGQLVSPNQWYDTVGDFNDGFAEVRLNGKYNFINGEGQIISPNQWYDTVSDFYEGFAFVELKEKWNFIKTDGQLVSPNQWFDETWNFHNGFAIVKLNRKWNFINTDGQLINPNRWFDGVYKFNEGFAKVNLNGEWFHINTKGERVD